MTNCGISRWDDPNEINARLKALTSQPIWEVTDDYYNNVILKYFDEQCKGSKAVYEESKEYIPGGVQHNLAFNKPFPMCMAKANGAYLYDKDGNRYIDFLQAGGPTILGSNYPVIREKVIELLNECGPVTGLLHESELMIAREINRHMPNVEMFRTVSYTHLDVYKRQHLWRARQRQRTHRAIERARAAGWGIYASVSSFPVRSERARLTRSDW